jgi:hypothetical protein
MEVAGHKVFTTPYANIYALVEEMAAVTPQVFVTH